MALYIRRFTNGIQIQLVGSTAIDTAGEIELLNITTGVNKLNFHNGTSTSYLVTEDHAATLTNKTISATFNTITNIGYSALTLTDSIVNGDINSAAAIAYSKLDLTGSVNLTSDVTAILPEANGGTGTTSFTQYGLLVAGASALTTLAVAAAGTLLTGGGASANPAFSSTPTLGINATTAGTLGLANGGGSGATVTLQNLGATTAYNFNLPTTAGTSGYVLTSAGGASSSMTWTSVLTNPMTGVGDIIYGGSSGAPTQLVAGTAGQVFTSNGTGNAPSYQPLGMPSGAIIAYGGTSAPTGYLLCDGTSYLRATYTALYSAIGNAYGTADGTHFNVPDLRGNFLRGVDGGAGRDPNTSTRTAAKTGGNTGDNVGSVQGATTARPTTAFTTASSNTGGPSSIAHTHTYNYSSGSGSGFEVVNAGQSNQGSNFQNGIVGAVTDGGIGSHTHSTPSVSITGGGDSETRPLNTYVTYIIKT